MAEDDTFLPVIKEKNESPDVAPSSNAAKVIDISIDDYGVSSPMAGLSPVREDPVVAS